MSDAARREAGATWYPLVAGAIVGAIALAAITPLPVGVFWDDGVYLIGAKSLATGAGYRFLHLPGAPPAVHFPPAWPALLALVWKLGPAFPGNVALLKLVNPLLLALGAALVCRYGVRRLGVPPLVAAATAVIFTAALPVMVMAGVLFSEPLFLVALLLALTLADRAVDAGGVRAAIAAGVAAGLLALVRSAGIAMAPALVAALLLARRRREAAAALAAAALVLAPWQLWIVTHVHQLPAPFRGAYGPYLDWVMGLYRQRGPGFALVVARMNLLAVMRSLGITLFPFGPREIRPLLVTLVLVVGAIAAIRARRRAAPALLFVCAYVAMVLAWPYSPDRFMWAIWPLLGMLLAAGAVACWRIGAPAGTTPGVRVTGAFACTIGVFAIAGHAGYSVRGASRHWWDAAARTNADALVPVAQWVSANTAPGDVVAVDGEPFIYLYTGRTVVPVHILSPDEYSSGTPIERAAADLRAIIVAGKPRYAVLSSAPGEREVASLIDGRNGTPRLVWLAALPGGDTAYRVDPAP